MHADTAADPEGACVQAKADDDPEQDQQVLEGLPNGSALEELPNGSSLEPGSRLPRRSVQWNEGGASCLLGSAALPCAAARACHGKRLHVVQTI